MRQRDPFGEAVTAVRDRVRTGRLPPGEPLVVEDLARDLGLSATPVREALAHLSGRGVIEGRRAAGRGYAAWPIAGDVLADLYRFQGLLASFALERAAEQGAGQVERTSQASTDAASRAGPAGTRGEVMRTFTRHPARVAAFLQCNADT